MPLRQPSPYSTEFILGACNPTVARAGANFGFEMSHVRIRNAGNVPIHFNLTSSAQASTDDAELEAGGVFFAMALMTSQISLTTTSTTTSTAADGNRVTVAAWGGL